ncbi:MAG: restriction endonuclease, partial [Deltaproteobacteria bacterium]
RISRRGHDVLEGRPNKLDVRFLGQFAEFKGTQATSSPGFAADTNVAVVEPGKTPEELIEESHQTLRRALADELLARIKECSPRFFETLVIDLLVGMGYGGSIEDAGQAIGRSGDGGLDGIIKEDRLGLDVVYLQAKRWEKTVGRPVVQAFAGSLEGRRARKGVLITTSDFSREATEYVEHIEKRIVLIGGEELTRLMIDHGIGVTPVATYTVKRLDLDYFEGGDYDGGHPGKLANETR